MDSDEVIVVALDASKEITDYALEWAVSNVITKAMDSVIMLAVLPCHGNAPTSANRKNNFLSCLMRKWVLRNRRKEKNSSARQDSFQGIHNICVEMLHRVCLAYEKQVHSQVKVVADAEGGTVASVAMELEATWVIMDRSLKKESDCCLNQLTCNVVIIDPAASKLLRAVNPLTRRKFSVSTDQRNQEKRGILPSSSSNYKSGTTSSDLGTESTTFEIKPSISLSSSGIKSESDCQILRLNSKYIHGEAELQTIFSPSPCNYNKPDNLSSLNIGDQPRKSIKSISDDQIKNHSSLLKTASYMETTSSLKPTKVASVSARISADSPCLFRESESPNQLTNRKHFLSSIGEEKPASPSSPSTLQRASSIRKAMSLSFKNPPIPPPLCSICKQDAPVFGRAPRKFTYGEIETATDGFSSDNLLADGGFGLVYKGTLDDGQVVAVKKQKILSAKGASEFCSEVEILSCAQHRNLVMLIGYCIEMEWLLVYEFACNGSLDKHLYGSKTNEIMAWHSRMKVAVGAARGLRYLHEDCRVGCIVHRDIRPNNILLTHDFEPMIGDFGLARWQVDGQYAEETRVIGAFGYLAPEYTQTGLITEKADVYAFGVVLLELLSGNKATEFLRMTGQQHVHNLDCALLERKTIDEVIDPRLKQNYMENEVVYMMHAARSCISPNPEKRPRMSKVLKILEGDISTDLISSYGLQAAKYPNQYVNNMYGIDSLMVSPTDRSPSSLLQSTPDKNPVLSRTSVDRITLKAFGPLKLQKQ